MWRIGEQHSATLIEAVIGALERPVPGGGLDVDPPLGLVAESSVGWFGTPGIEGHRPDGRDFAPQFSLRSIEADQHRAEIGLVDEAAQLSLTIGVVLHASGVATFQASISNDGDTAVRARRSAAQPSRPVTGAGTADRRWSVDERVRPDPHTVDRQLPDDREPARQDITRASRRRLRRNTGIHRTQRGGVGLPHRMERQLRDHLRFGHRWTAITAGRRTARLRRGLAAAGARAMTPR